MHSRIGLVILRQPDIPNKCPIDLHPGDALAVIGILLIRQPVMADRESPISYSGDVGTDWYGIDR